MKEATRRNTRDNRDRYKSQMRETKEAAEIDVRKLQERYDN
jgi:hypothetical protein